MLYHDYMAYPTFKIVLVLQGNTVATGVVFQPVKVHYLLHVQHNAKHLLIWVNDTCEIVRAYSRYVNE